MPSLYERIKSALFDQHPELRYREPVLRMEAGGSKPASSDYGQNARYYEIETWVQKAVRIWKDNIADKKILIIEKNGDETTVLHDHPFAELLDNPNDEMSASDLWSEWAVDMALGGEHGLEVTKGRLDGSPLEIYPTKPTQFGVTPAKGNDGFRYRKVDYYRIVPGGLGTHPYNVPPDEFIHFKFYNPLNLWRGLAPITAVRNGIKLNLYAGGWALGFYQNGARPDYALIAPEGMTADEREEYRLQLMSEHGQGHAHEPIILENGVTDIKTFAFPPSDMQWLEHKRVSRDEIGAIFGVPDGIMGWGQESYDTATKLDGDVKALWMLTLEPVINFRDDRVTRFGRMIGQLEKNQYSKTDLSKVAVLQEDVTGKVAMLDMLAGRGYPVNVAADYLQLGLEHIPGGDTGYLPFSVVPVESIETGETLEDQETDERDERDQTRTVKAKRAPEFGSRQHEAIFKRKQSRNDPFVDKMKRKLKKYFQDQQNEVTRNLRQSRDLGRGQYKGIEREQVKQDLTPSLDQLFDLQYWVTEFVDRFENIITLTVMSVGQDEINALNALGADLSDFEGRPEVISAIREILEETARKVNDTTFIALTDLFVDAEIAGESIPSIMERLSAFFGDRKSDWQTERIARTTITASSNAGDLLAWGQSNIVAGKTWISALIPKRTRETHAAAHGQTVRLNESFNVGGEPLQHPGDPQGSPENVINCLCTQIAEVNL